MVDSVIPGQRSGSRTKLQDVQRYNVAVSRAKDQVWLFHSISLNQLGNREDLRYRLIEYAQRISNKFEAEPGGLVPVSESVRVKPFDSLFEQRVYNRIIERGYRVTPQYPVMGYRIDLVVEGEHGKLAVECDGDVWHGPDAQKNDMRRQRDLERCSWEFYRIWESDFYANPQKALEGLWSLLDEKNIFPLTDIFTKECASLGDDISGGKNKSSVLAPAQVPQQSR